MVRRKKFQDPGINPFTGQPTFEFQTPAFFTPVPTGGVAKPKPIPSPEPIIQKEQTQAGQAFIQAREKLASQLEAKGMTSKEAHAAATKAVEQEQAGLSFRQVSPGARKQAEAELFAAITPSQAEITGANLPKFKVPGLKGEFTEEELGALRGAAAKIIDTLRVGITGKKPLTVQQAEGSLTDALILLGNDVDLVKAGLKNPRDARNNILLAEQALNRLERSQKGIGQENLRYWSDNGQEIQTEIILKREEIDNLKSEMIQAGLDVGFR